ncbi:homoarginine-6-hydroxylase 2-ODD-233 isoform X2 [Physcomitrium patens]|uniref:homoarginine-6-hydroxylase 2-ODD-233 isoform X2 n=1 Tax=Physcomitrium patens TaxID=3218 RepID=UPI000D1640D1|nr:probable 2-oxoglutarate-dependent dioxygenase At3g50210 isoform X2 [Physcomitrium patens]XP_024358723.1 probable 2-oxoglutarate-dependent dioxygenase At3g50210 isoform X2 [Physcomitrium patens]XP_024358724.1 probable 2-oxoglutarate-dependent dioxygenase At3g50210 isoform X2 [Physcomitrium patens]XP_024358725.1 probable 2-oxoglutarate-dependent dioxygenase At3g50210 isoform X2 [Physcomitrium patens]|eukprot:XP_024358722.1 probable 2-oxoglutarate-dependent dioxygenase At3g50210 isoform X2 [Physcomitrella patens]
MFDSIPIIDVGPLVRKKGDEDFREDPESGHGIPLELCQAVLDVGHEFFSQPESQKLRIAMSSSTGFRGYQKLGENVTKGLPDQHEAIDYFKEFESTKVALRSENPLVGLNQWPDSVSKFRPLVQEYLEMLIELARTIMRGIALALGGPKDLFEGERAGDPFWILRVIGYPPISNLSCLSNPNGEEVGCGDHTDYGLLTLVNQDLDITALQVKTQDGKYIWVDPIPGTFVVNIGDMLTIWTNGLYQSTLHRVMNNDSKYRVSVPFFYEPNFDARVEPFSFLQDSTAAESKRYTPVVYGDHVINKVLNNFG